MSWNGPLIRLDEYRWMIPRSYKTGMKTDAIIYANEGMVQSIISDDAPEQVANVACLPGIVGCSLAMPDIHWGYGFPIGGVAAMDMQDGVISPGGIGFDINCGVRLLRTPLTVDEVRPRLKELIDSLFESVPSGLGSRAKEQRSWDELDDILANGSQWAVSEGYGYSDDLGFTESGGRMEKADPEKVSDRAKKRGRPQVGSLGSGNHFVEVDYVENVGDAKAAEAFGLREGMVTVTIHTGSRGCGHQIATDYLKVMERSVREQGIRLPDRQLACAPIQSEDGIDYFTAMNCGANYAWCNRQMLTHWVRKSFSDVLGLPGEDMGLVYDVAHNIAKTEEHRVDGESRKVMVHRKGATRAFPAGNPEIPEPYRAIGQPAIVPGDMGSGTYVIVGNDLVMDETFGSTCHGAGRTLSRKAAIRKFDVKGVRKELSDRGIYLRSTTEEGVLEEAPGAYKNVDDVVSVMVGSGLARMVVKLTPLGVIKG